MDETSGFWRKGKVHVSMSSRCISDAIYAKNLQCHARGYAGLYLLYLGSVFSHKLLVPPTSHMSTIVVYVVL